MKRSLLYAACISVVVHQAGFEAAGQTEPKKVVHAFLAKEEHGKPETIFSADVLKIYLIWKGEHLEAGNQIRFVWIAEDVGNATLKESKIGERSVIVYHPDDGGSIFLSRPRATLWPVGQYRTEVFIATRLAQTLKFSITPGVSVEVH
jgi:hypothetical protein